MGILGGFIVGASGSTLSEAEGRTVWLSNLVAVLVAALCIIGCIIALSLLPLSPSHATLPFLWSALVCSLSLLLVPWLNHRGWRTLARFYVLLVSCVGCLVGFIIHGSAAGAEIPLIPIAMLAFMLFLPQERVPLTLGVLLPCATFFVIIIIGHLQPESTAPTPGALAYHTVAAVTSFLGASFLSFLYFRDLWLAQQKRLEAEKEVEEQQVTLIANAKMAALGVMAAGISHEINNPLTVILGRVNRLQNMLAEVQPDRQIMGEICASLTKDAFRIAKIIKGLHIFARESSGDPLLCVDTVAIVHEVISLTKDKLNADGVTLNVICPAVPVEVNCRESEIVQILLNLIANSIDSVAHLQEKWISIELGNRDDWIDIAVTDSGPGIPNSIQQSIFLPFFTTKDLGKGTGLGLSISKGLAETNMGTLQLDHKCLNTRFVLSLPRK